MPPPRKLKRWLVVLSAGLMELLTITACGSLDKGTITGVYLGMGNGRSHVGGNPSPGTLTITGDGRTFSTTAGDNGRFAVSVPAGTYHLTGRPPGQTGGISSCQLAGIHVTAGQTTRVAVTCGFH